MLNPSLCGEIKHCVYFLCDNFSRKILAWRVAPNVSWQYVKECITDAYQATSLNALP
ncbi:MAG: hypothetical protein H7331_05920, partial [Bacteroidia bacterium]|nr:hypothetical protein [Bacteroidia bacterium]